MFQNNTYTEDAVFLKLSRPGFEEMKELYDSWWESNPNKDTRQRIPFMLKYKWTWLEFLLENRKRYAR